MSEAKGNPTSNVATDVWDNDQQHITPVATYTEKYDEKKGEDLTTVEVYGASDVKGDVMIDQQEVHAATVDIERLLPLLPDMSIERALKILKQIWTMHRHDQNFDLNLLHKIQDFIDNSEEYLANPERHEKFLTEMRLEALMATHNSPYPFIRAVVDPDDDPTEVSLTMRVLFIGIIFSALGSFTNQLMHVRTPSLILGANVVQLISYPIGKLFARVLPDWGFTLFGTRHSLNPGKFTKKEHMLIVIMAQVGMGDNYVGNIILVQALPQFFNQPWARSRGYQMLNTLAIDLAGYGLAGLCRAFLVWPAYCVHPSLLGTLAIQRSLHLGINETVQGPFRRLFTASRMKVFYIFFCAGFVWWWFPNVTAEFIMWFNWIPWIAPKNIHLNNITSIKTGLGINPIYSLDWTELLTITTIPFILVNKFVGSLLASIMALSFYYSNTFSTGYIPLMVKDTYDHFGKRYNVTKVLTPEGFLDNNKYQNYSEAYMSAGNLTSYFFFFASYSAAFTYAPLYHGHEIKHALIKVGGNLKKQLAFWKKNKAPTEAEMEVNDEDVLGEDVHYRNMQKYAEAPEWWYLVVLAISIILGCLGVGLYPTHTTVGVVFYGILFGILFLIPLGIVDAVTSSAPTLNVLAQLIGGTIAGGNALEMNFFKMYGLMCTSNAMRFCQELKLGHYAKIPPRHTFTVQIVATLVNGLVVSNVYNLLMSFEDVCTDDSRMRFFCYGVRTFFTASVFWGTMGVPRMLGSGGRFRYLLIGFPFGLLAVLFFFLLQKKYPRSKLLRSAHPVIMFYQALLIGPYYMICQFFYYLPTTWLSWYYIKPRFIDFWSKYNFIMPMAVWGGAAIAGLIMAVTLGIQSNYSHLIPDWWGNNPDSGCTASMEKAACRYMKVPANPGYFGPAPGHYH